MALQVFVLDRVLEEDGITGDAYGPYDAVFVAEERERVAREKVLLQLSSVFLTVPCQQWLLPCQERVLHAHTARL